ncbi:MAG: hypothetical protein ACLGGV_08960 [Bacteroidia bacterium]
MKTLKSTLLFISLGLFVFTSCKKKANNETAEDLGGNWQIVTITKASGVVDPNSMPQSVTLNSCNVKKDDCMGEWVSQKGDKNNFFWTVSDKGETLSIIIDESQPSNQATSDLAEYKGDYTIQELTDVKLVIKKEQTTIEFKQ